MSSAFYPDLAPSPQRAPKNAVVLKTLYNVEILLPSEVAELEARSGKAQADYIKKRLQRLFRRAAPAIFGAHLHNKNFCQLVIKGTLKAPWRAHLIRPYSVGGTFSPHNRVVMLASTHQAMHEKVVEQLKGAEYVPETGKTVIPQLIIEKPLFSLLLPQRDSTLFLPVVNNDGALVELPLPLGNYDQKTYSNLGFRNLAKELARRCSKPIPCDTLEEDTSQIRTFCHTPARRNRCEREERRITRKSLRPVRTQPVSISTMKHDG